MKTNDERLAEIYRRSSQRIQTQKRRLRAAVSCVPLVICIGFGALWVRSGTPVDLPAHESVENTENRADDVSQELKTCTLRVTGKDMDAFYSDPATVEEVRSTLAVLLAQWQYVHDFSADTAKAQSDTKRGEVETYTIVLTQEDGSELEYQLQENALTDFQKRVTFSLNSEQYRQLKSALGIDAQ